VPDGENMRALILRLSNERCYVRVNDGGEDYIVMLHPLAHTDLCTLCLKVLYEEYMIRGPKDTESEKKH
jgi:hypothetical protein